MPLKLAEYEAAPGGAEHPEVLAIPDGEVTLAWHNDYYDGPLAGMARYKGELHYFKMVEQSECDAGGVYPGWYRRYALIKLTPEQMEAELTRHTAFREHVSERCDYENPGPVKPRETHHLFYDKYPPSGEFHSLDDNEVLGWFAD